MSELALALRILRGEGALAVRDRILDRVTEHLRRARFTTLDVGTARRALDPFDPPVLNLSPVPPAPARGGAQAQMLDRLAVEATRRPVALAYPHRDSLVLEIRHGSRAGRLRVAAGGSLSDHVVELARGLGARIVHVESPAGLPLALVPRLAEAGFTTILSLHDFTLFCRRPHLIEATTGRFCGYCRDDRRCRACLTCDGFEVDQTSYREAGRRALEVAHQVVYPSDFLCRQHATLFPDSRGGRPETVIPPATAYRAPVPRDAVGGAVVAFVGGASRHKGGHLFRKVADEVRRDLPEARFVSFGNGDEDILAELRQAPNIHVRGYYRRGALPRLLVDVGAKVAVFASIWPETYGMTVDECLRTGVPVVAFDHGAVGERAARLEGLHVVPLDTAAQGLASAVCGVLRVGGTRVDAKVAEALPSPERSAEHMQELYRVASRPSPGGTRVV